VEFDTVAAAEAYMLFYQTKVGAPSDVSQLVSPRSASKRAKTSASPSSLSPPVGSDVQAVDVLPSSLPTDSPVKGDVGSSQFPYGFLNLCNGDPVKGKVGHPVSVTLIQALRNAITDKLQKREYFRGRFINGDPIIHKASTVDVIR
jgi:hypothetical protein